MQAQIDGVLHRIRFNHRQEYSESPAADWKDREKEGGGKLVMRKVPKPFPVKVQFTSDSDDFVSIPAARAVTACTVLIPMPSLLAQARTKQQALAAGSDPDTIIVPADKPKKWEVVRSALAVCSWSEKSFNKEFARQLALARVLEGLPRSVGGPLLAAYMGSGPRTLCDLSAASRGRYKHLADALPKKPATIP